MKMVFTRKNPLALLAVTLLVIAAASATAAAQEKPAPMKNPLGVTVDDCRACHSRAVQEWEQSYHAKSVVASHGGFKRYITTQEQAKGRPLHRDELMACLGCHAPAMRFAADAEITRLVELVKTDQREALATLSVDCVACHTLSASGHPETKPPDTLAAITFHGTIQNPSPSPHKTQFASEMGQSEFCKNCHTYVTPAHLKVQADWDVICSLTYDNWAEGPHGVKSSDRKDCQFCHMEKADGNAAEGAPARKVSSHLFPGWHSAPMMQKATVLSVESRPNSPGKIDLIVTIENKAGHRLPDT